MKRIAVLVSGGGTNLQTLIDAQARDELGGGKIVAVLSSKPGAYALVRAVQAGIDGLTVSRQEYPDAGDYSRAVEAALEPYTPDLVVHAGFLSILDKTFCDKYPWQMNIHPALIPAFCGKGMFGLRVHRAVLAAGVRVTGATVHLVNAIPDGGPIVLQSTVAVLPHDTPESLQQRVMTQCEHILLPKAVRYFCQDRLEVMNGKVSIRPNQVGGTMMKPDNITHFLEGNAYPGRGIFVGRSPDGNKIFMIYFIMGRSVNSRNRIFEATEDGIRTKAYDESLMTDPSLVIYHPVREIAGKTIITNGDQTDTLRDGLRDGKSYTDALRTRCFEPDEPHYTPRISAVVDNATGSYCLSILKSQHGDPGCNNRYFYEYDTPPAGQGHLIHTYAGDGNALPSFEGEPRLAAIRCGHVEELADLLWEALDVNNKISLFVRAVDMTTGQAETIIKNKHGRYPYESTGTEVRL